MLILVSDMLLRIARSGTVIAAYLRPRASPTMRLPLLDFFPSYAEGEWPLLTFPSEYPSFSASWQAQWLPMPLEQFSGL
jgi:hypothetical protein